jgi:hypothetical protein
VTEGSAFTVSDVSFAVGYDFTVHGAFAVDSMAMGAEVVVGGDVAQELATLIGADCRAKYGAAPDNATVDGVSYMPVLPRL